MQTSEVCTQRVTFMTIVEPLYNGPFGTTFLLIMQRFYFCSERKQFTDMISWVQNSLSLVKSFPGESFTVSILEISNVLLFASDYS